MIFKFVVVVETASSYVAQTVLVLLIFLPLLNNRYENHYELHNI
jgi:hypothetical protein